MAPYITPLGHYGYYIVPAGVAKKHNFSKSDLEKTLSRKIYVGQGGSKEPPGGIFVALSILGPCFSPMALCTRAQLKLYQVKNHGQKHHQNTTTPWRGAAPLGRMSK